VSPARTPITHGARIAPVLGPAETFGDQGRATCPARARAPRHEHGDALAGQPLVGLGNATMRTPGSSLRTLVAHAPDYPCRVGSLRFRRSLKIAAGVRLNVTKTGFGVTAGPRGAHYSINSSGTPTRSVALPSRRPPSAPATGARPWRAGECRRRTGPIPCAARRHSAGRRTTPPGFALRTAFQAASRPFTGPMVLLR
jgi:hypothetical protein